MPRPHPGGGEGSNPIRVGGGCESPPLLNLILGVVLEQGEASPARLARLLSHGKDRRYRRRIYYRIRRLCERLAKEGALVREEIPYHPALASSPSKYTVTYRPGPALVNLMVCGALFKLPHRAEKVAYIPRRAHPTRRRAIFLLSHQIMLDDHSRNLLISLFSAYLEDTAEKVIVLRHVETGELLPMPYRHRFTPQGMRDLLRKFDAVWERAMKQADREGWKVAVFLTLTTDPSKHGSLMEGYRRSGEALNRFMS